MTRLDMTVRARSTVYNHRLELGALGGPPRADQGQIQLTLDGEPLEVGWAETAPGAFSILLDGRSYQATLSSPAEGRNKPVLVTVGGQQYAVEIHDPRQRRSGGVAVGAEGPQEIVAPMPGKIVKILVSESDEISAGQGLVVIEAMKMQNELRASRPGRVEKIHIVEGARVEAGSKLLRVG